MIWVDYAVLVLLAMTTLVGFWRGFRFEAYATVIWLTGIFTGLIFARPFTRLLNNLISEPIVELVIAFVGLLVITLVLGSLIGILLSDVLARTDFWGRIFGSVIGLIRGALIVSVVVILAGLTPLPTEAWWREAQLILPFQKAVLRMRDKFPSDLSPHINYE